MLKYRTIGEAWLSLCQLCVRDGRRYKIQRGSYKGQQRAQLDFVALEITNPADRPFAIEFVGMPISDDASIQAYYENYLISHLLDPDKEIVEQYTYGERVGPYLFGIMEMLKETPDTNQASINVGILGDVFMEDPPCLRVLDWKVIDGLLVLTSFWRSHDGVGGFPTNIAGLQLLNEMVADYANLTVGPQYIAEPGLHVYDHHWKLFQ